MNRENKRKTLKKGYYKNHACSDAFTCKVCGRLCTPDNAGSSHRNHCPNCLASLHVDIEPGDREADCGGIMEPGRRLGAPGRRVGHHPPVPPLRHPQLQPHGGGRQSHEAHVDCAEAPVRAAVPARAHRGDDASHGRRRGAGAIRNTDSGHKEEGRSHAAPLFDNVQ